MMRPLTGTRRAGLVAALTFSRFEGSVGIRVGEPARERVGDPVGIRVGESDTIRDEDAVGSAQLPGYIGVLGSVIAGLKVAMVGGRAREGVVTWTRGVAF